LREDIGTEAMNHHPGGKIYTIEERGGIYRGWIAGNKGLVFVSPGQKTPKSVQVDSEKKGVREKKKKQRGEEGKERERTPLRPGANLIGEDTVL